MIDKILAKKYQISKKLGSGAFGQVFLAINIINKQQVAIKIQDKDHRSPQLFNQAKLLNILQDSQKKITDHGIPRCYQCFQQGQYNIMVMNLLGLSLQDLFTINNKKFDLKTTLMIGIQMLQRIKYLHDRGIIHRDIKPDNFVLGGDKKSYKIYLIDYGLAKKYIQTNDGKHIGYKDNKNLSGTARYASLNTHLGIQQSRRDDIQGIAHVLIYFFKGRLPWQNVQVAQKKERYEKIMQRKITTPLKYLCADLPPQFYQLIKHARSLNFEQRPNYEGLIQMMKNRMIVQGMDYDYGYCWGQMPKQCYQFTVKSNSNFGQV